MKYSLAPYDVVLEIGEQMYAVKVKGQQFARHVRRDGTLLGVTNIAADQEVTVIGKVHSDVDASAEPEPRRRKPKSKPEPEPVEPVRLEFDQAARGDFTG